MVRLRHWYVLLSVLLGIALENARRRRQERQDERHLLTQFEDLGGGPPPPPMQPGPIDPPRPPRNRRVTALRIH